MNIQGYINDQATGILKTVHIEALRGVIAFWDDGLRGLRIIYYFEKEPTEDDREEASVVTSYILAALPMIDKVEEEFLVLHSSKPFPESNFWVFRKGI